MKETTIVIEVRVSVKVQGNWGDDCTIGQMKKQAKEEATSVLKRATHGHPLILGVSCGDVIFTTKM